ncbi:hypothetical protein KP509_28G014100 [Ceratopteris richardii]|uniref:S-adenosyl-L-methionine-dependent methyltransferase superfamily protein n=1 Tax=Ceratopteris richardii TaxID=49495 RepID=A0A8T2RBH0_CERRI|nr:hypothetical protein KP509_28G014100 [Ceratopteris richardii]
MGRGKHKPQRIGRGWRQQSQKDDEGDGIGDVLPSSAFDISLSPSPDAKSFSLGEKEEARDDAHYLSQGPSKYQLYQDSVQSPKGDISYLQKFFLQYIGGRSPMHLREDFCSTALICAEWLKGGIHRVATGLDLDLEALTWGLSNNFTKVGGSACTRVCLLHGDVLKPLSSAKLVSLSTDAKLNETKNKDLECNPSFKVDEGHDDIDALCTNLNGSDLADSSAKFLNEKCSKEDLIYEPAECHSEFDGKRLWPAIDVACAFNYSCCCLHDRADLLLYFKYVRSSLSEKGGIFSMDLYGGVSSEGPLKLYRHFHDFTYIWEQDTFDIISRMTKISLHFRLKNNRMIRHAFTYNWRLWSLPEVHDCLKEAGFDSVHFWIRRMPSQEEIEGYEDEWDDKYVESTEYCQDLDA